MTLIKYEVLIIKYILLKNYIFFFHVDNFLHSFSEPLKKIFREK